MSDDKETSAPPWAQLRTLEEASRNFENDENAFTDQWLNQLIKLGSSLGGARPKATVADTEGGLWIAKFPSRNDESDTGAWEKVVHDLAGLCGLNVPKSKLEKFSKLGSTFLSGVLIGTGSEEYKLSGIIGRNSQKNTASHAGR